MNAFDFDAREVTELAADLGRVSGAAVPLIDGVMRDSAERITEELAADARGSRHFRQIAPAMSFDRDYRIGQVGYEMGPDRSRTPAAALANIAYFGGSNGGGGTLDISAPLRSEEPRMMAALDKALGDLL